MANERTYAILPCPEIDAAIAFYEALGFTRTYRQVRPNPSAVVAFEDIHIHLAAIDGFDPAGSYGSVIITVPDADALYRTFAAGLRAAYGKLPVAGIPRILRPRKRFGTVRGFSVVDVGGNWLRVHTSGLVEDAEAVGGLAQQIVVAARLADAHGDDARALKTLENGLTRYPDADAPDRARALLYRADLAVRLHRTALARASLAEADAVELAPSERDDLADDRAHVVQLVDEAPA